MQLQIPPDGLAHQLFLSLFTRLQTAPGLENGLPAYAASTSPASVFPALSISEVGFASRRIIDDSALYSASDYCGLLVSPGQSPESLCRAVRGFASPTNESKGAD